MARDSVRSARVLGVVVVTMAAAWFTTSTAWAAQRLPASVSAPIVTAISTSGRHSCAIQDGAAKCWGYNVNGQLGNGSSISTDSPVQVSGLDAAVTEISTGDHSCAIWDGAAKCWGYNVWGQLGDGTNTSSLVPVQVSGLETGVTAITGAGYHSCAIQDGAAKCWGNGATGGLGNDTKDVSNVPVQVSGLDSGVTAISAGNGTACAIHNGAVKCWGANVLAPVQVPGLESGVTAITSGYNVTCAIQDGAAKCWGVNNAGQLGDGTTIERYAPVQVSGLESGVTAITAGQYHTCAVHDGAATCWGRNGDGQLGDGTNTDSLVPVQVSGLDSGVTAISAGMLGNASCAIQDGAAKCWGANASGVLGDGSDGSSNVPVQVVGMDYAPPTTTTTTPTTTVVSSVVEVPVPEGSVTDPDVVEPGRKFRVKARCRNIETVTFTLGKEKRTARCDSPAADFSRPSATAYSGVAEVEFTAPVTPGVYEVVVELGSSLERYSLTVTVIGETAGPTTTGPVGGVLPATGGSNRAGGVAVALLGLGFLAVWFGRRTAAG